MLKLQTSLLLYAIYLALNMISELLRLKHLNLRLPLLLEITGSYLTQLLLPLTLRAIATPYTQLDCVLALDDLHIFPDATARATCIQYMGSGELSFCYLLLVVIAIVEVHVLRGASSVVFGYIKLVQVIKGGVVLHVSKHHAVTILLLGV